MGKSSGQGHLTTFVSFYYVPGGVSCSVGKIEKRKNILQGNKCLDGGKYRGSNSREGPQTTELEQQARSSWYRLEEYLGLILGGLVSSSSNSLHFEACASPSLAMPLASTI